MPSNSGGGGLYAAQFCGLGVECVSYYQDTGVLQCLSHMLYLQNGVLRLHVFQRYQCVEGIRKAANQDCNDPIQRRLARASQASGFLSCR